MLSLFRPRAAELCGRGGTWAAVGQTWLRRSPAAWHWPVTAPLGDPSALQTAWRPGRPSVRCAVEEGRGPTFERPGLLTGARPLSRCRVDRAAPASSSLLPRSALPR